MKQKRTLPVTTYEQKKLLAETMKLLDGQFDEESSLLGTREGGHGVRVSAHYAVGLFARGQAGDKERAAKVLQELLKLQYDCGPEEAFYGGFPRNDREIQPPSQPFPGRHFDAYSRFYLEKWQETILEKMKRHLLEAGYDRQEVKDIFRLYSQSAAETVPVVWTGFDPNWREFIGTDLAIILGLFQEDLDEGLTGRLERSLERAVMGSVTRYRNHVCPMNTNIELMHVFICAFLGERLNRSDLLEHAVEAAVHFEKQYLEFHSVGEYNSSTYYSVDLFALSAWRQLLETKELQRLGSFLEAEIWKDIAVMYQPLLKNLCGPFSRGYEMDMSIHSLMPALLYLGLGKDWHNLPAFNCELAGNVNIALLGTCIPEACKEALTVFGGERQVETLFGELRERSHPDEDTGVCTATAFIARDYMIGALRGSQNTSGQLRSAAAFWKAGPGAVSNLVLLRREPGENCEHVRTVYFNNRVDKNHMEIHVIWELERDMELVFAITGTDLKPDMIGKEVWELPGMRLLVRTGEAPPKVNLTQEGIEVVYAYRWKEADSTEMDFVLDFECQWERQEKGNEAIFVNGR